jgi:DNA-binding FrmR family transcriptional regulator
MTLSKKLQTELINRLHRLEGHVRGVAGMIERQEPCDDILVQLAAVKSAVNQVILKLLEGHMDGCVQRCLTEGDAGEIERFKKSLSLILKHF